MKKRTDSFDLNATNLVKGIAICIMVYYHLFGATDRMMFFSYATVLLNIVGPYGDVCVVFFVMLTGYGTMCKLGKREGSPYLAQTLPQLGSLFRGYWAVFLPVFFLAPLLGQGMNDWVTIYGFPQPSWIIHALVNFFGLSHLIYGGYGYTMNQTWWYISLAILMVFVLPLLVRICKKLGSLRWILLLGSLVVTVVLIDIRYMVYLFPLTLGVCAADGDWFVRLNRLGEGKLLMVLVKLVAAAGILVLWYRCRQNYFYTIQADALCAFAVTQCAFDLIRLVRPLNAVLVFLGRHSANIFYIHSLLFIYWVWCRDFLFSLRLDFLIWAMVMGISILLSMGIEAVKKLLRCNQRGKALEKRILEGIFPAQELKL